MIIKEHFDTELSMLNYSKNVEEKSLFNKNHGRTNNKSPSKNASNSSVGEYQNDFVASKT